MRTKRQGLFIWFRHRRNIKQIKRYGHLIYVSKKQNYALVYVNQTELEKIEMKLKNRPFVSKIERSHLPFIPTTFSNKELSETKPHDYNMGV